MPCSTVEKEIGTYENNAPLKIIRPEFTAFWNRKRKLCADFVRMEEIVVHRRHNVSHGTKNVETLHPICERNRAKRIKIDLMDRKGNKAEELEVRCDSKNLLKLALIPYFHRSHVF